MTFLYTAYWYTDGSGDLDLCGVILADHDSVHIYFPEHQDVRYEWRQIITLATQSCAGTDMRDWLVAMSSSGNGITDEFSGISEITGTTIEAAAEQAYDDVAQQKGKKLTPFDLSNPVPGWSPVTSPGP